MRRLGPAQVASRGGLTMSLPKPSLPVISINGRRGPSDEGKLLRLPEDYTPLSPEVHSAESARKSVNTQQLLADEDAHLKSIGLTWEELQEYQRLLLKKF